MATAFQEFIETLKEKINLVEVAGEYMSLERRGVNYWACCPFHHEKTPSFSINEPNQFYHCFGCGESGNVINFVCNMENIGFMDAVKLLADRVKLPLPETGYDSRQTAELKRKRDVILKILNDCAHFYLKNLNSGRADEHIAYILQRKIPSNIVRAFGLGASLNFYELPKYLMSKGYDKQDLFDSGAVTEADGKPIDALGKRLIYPIINNMDEVVAFGGRVLQPTERAKYKNTRETVVFNKSKTLYNINLLKKLKREKTINEVIIVEGYMDVISLYQAGFKNVVASMGTSLTLEQAKTLKRYTDNVLISYDGDAAGQKANLRGLDILKNEGLNVKVVPLPEGLDPDDVIKQRGAEGYQDCLNNAMPLIDFKLECAKKGLDVGKSEDKRKYVAEAIKIVKKADSAAEQEELLKSLRTETGISLESLKRDLNASAAEVVKTAVPQREERKDFASGGDKASRFVIASFLFGAGYTRDKDVSSIPYTSEVHEIIAKFIKAKTMLGEIVRPAELFELFERDSDEFRELEYILDYSDGDSLSGEIAEKYFYDCIKKLEEIKTDREIANLNQMIEAETDSEAKKRYIAELQNLIILKKNIKSGDR